MPPIPEAPVLQAVTEQRIQWVPSHPLTVEEYLDLFGSDDDVELVDGIVVQRMAAQYEHERLIAWLITVLNLYATDRDLGVVLGSRSAVRISDFKVRLPDLLFVRKERMGIVGDKVIEGGPDLVIEVVSPGDRPSDIIGLESDYRAILVPEIVFIDLPDGRIRHLRRVSEKTYAEEVLQAGDSLALDAFGDLTLDAGTVLTGDLPNPRSIVP